MGPDFEPYWKPWDHQMSSKTMGPDSNQIQTMVPPSSSKPLDQFSTNFKNHRTRFWSSSNPVQNHRISFRPVSKTMGPDSDQIQTMVDYFLFLNLNKLVRNVMYFWKNDGWKRALQIGCLMLKTRNYAPEGREKKWYHVFLVVPWFFKMVPWFSRDFLVVPWFCCPMVFGDHYLHCFGVRQCFFKVFNVPILFA
jgi:hypothetical protein